MSKDGEENITGNSAQTAKVQLVVNRLWQEQCSEDTTRTLITSLMQQMRNGYTLVFPMMMDAGTVYMGVGLVAEHDSRTSAIKIDRVPGTTHLAMFLLFKDQAEWKSQTDKLITLWPEQPGLPCMVIKEQKS